MCDRYDIIYTIYMISDIIIEEIKRGIIYYVPMLPKILIKYNFFSQTDYIQVIISDD